MAHTIPNSFEIRSHDINAIILHGKFSSLVDILSWLLDKFLSDLACINMEKVTKSYYRAAIMKNSTSCKDPKVIAQSVEKKETDILAGLYHTVEHQDPEVQHQHCDIDWCKYLQSKRDGTAPKTSKRNKLPFRYLDEMLPLYERLSDVSLLARCVPGLTQNKNEAFNHTIWQRCPKEKYGSSQAVHRAVTSAVLKWNIGGIGRANMMSALGMQAGYHTKIAIAIMDTRRLKASALASSEQEKKKRKRKKEEQIKEDRHQKAQKGDGVLADKSNKAVSSAPKAEAWDNIYF